MDFFLATGLGLGSTEHGEEPKEGQVGRKGISCERTFARISAPEDLEAKVLPSCPLGCTEDLQQAAAAIVKSRCARETHVTELGFDAVHADPFQSCNAPPQWFTLTGRLVIGLLNATSWV
jgi:hypothetical protein